MDAWMNKEGRKKGENQEVWYKGQDMGENGKGKAKELNKNRNETWIW